jgi:imidazolonepropionase-like amidohydrolase
VVDAPRFHLHGTVLPDGVERDVWIVDGRFSFERVDDARTVARDAFLLPGLVDAHAHLGLHSPAPREASADERIRASGAAQLAAGVTLVREPGGPDRRSAGLGPADGMPRIQSAGRLLSPPGTYIPGLAFPAPDADLPEIAEAEYRSSGYWVKLIGDFPGRDGQVAAHYRPETLAATAARIHALGGRLAIHVNLPEVMDAAIDAGIDTLEHATGLAPSHIPELLRQGTVLVPTLLIRDDVRALFRSVGLPPDVMADQEDRLDGQPAMVLRAAEAGVPVLAGTDAGMGPHGRIRDEIGQLRAAGLAPDLALGAGSWVARAYLGLPGIEDGAPADVVAFARDPRIDPETLATPIAVIVDGRSFR